MSSCTQVNAYLADIELALQCADHLERRADDIVGVLTRHESHEAATEELHSSIDTLRNLHRELAYLRAGHVERIAVFLPINLPLYSLVLFAAVPSLMADRLDVRLPAATPTWLHDVADAARLGDFFPRVHLHEATRRQFVEGVASRATAVIFTGRYESAEQVRRQCPDSLFIFQGSGVNPVVIGPHASLSDDSLERIITTRLFNGGQDCAAPDAFLVHASKADEFVEQLVKRVEGVASGSYDDPHVRVGPILNKQPLKELADRLSALTADTVVGGRVDTEAGTVEPTVVVRTLGEHDELMEFFAPVFYVLVYETDAELSAFFNHPDYAENAMYVSLFGQSAPAELFETSTVLYDQTVLDVEQGNTAFGGNGAKANYVALGGHVEIGPVLISQALARAPQPSRRASAARVTDAWRAHYPSGHRSDPTYVAV
jgi:acyl-CoA reductase-like NAD-dependent aldehyde dehydrogenase